MIKKIFILVFPVFISLQACNDEIYSPIPSSPVNLTLDLRFEDSELNNVWACKRFTTRRLETDRLGYGGILVINGVGENILLNLYAYDLACPVEVSKEIRIVPNDLGKATCPKCGTVYNIVNGIGASESGNKVFLRSYPVSPLGNDRYRISN